MVNTDVLCLIVTLLQSEQYPASPLMFRHYYVAVK